MAIPIFKFDMTYLTFIIIFLIGPILLLATSLFLLRKRSKGHDGGMGWIQSILTISTIAVVYTTPWDNYLIAERIWWYDPDKVIGTIGFIPIEEYAFFVLQVVLTGLTLILVREMMHKLPFRLSFLSLSAPSISVRGWVTSILVGSCLIIFAAAQLGLLPGRYFSLLMLWALPPFALQAWVGADILMIERWPTLFAMGITTLYLSLADLMAIDIGIWTINPDETFGIYLFGILPLEEALFFLMTNALIVCGVTLCLSPLTWPRLRGSGVRLPSRAPSGD